MLSTVLPIDDDDSGARSWWEHVAGLVVLLGCTYLLLKVLQPNLLLRDTTTNGGDMGAHVWWPRFLADNWFGKLRLSGWAPDWYAGFPVGHFYFPLPAVMIAIGDVFLPYNVSFKLVSASGVVALPSAAYAFAIGMRAPWPAAPAFALASVATLVQTRWTIYGGNLASTLAGEFSFTMGLAFALFFLGALAYTLRTGRRAWLAAVLLAAAVLCHIVVALFAAVAAVFVWLVHRPLRSWRWALPVGLVAALLSAIWWFPLLAQQDYTTNMRYEKLCDGPIEWERRLGVVPVPVTGTVENPTIWDCVQDNLFDFPVWEWMLVGAAIVGAGWFRRRTTLVLLGVAASFGVLFKVWPEHHVWNSRFLPFWFLCVTFLAAMGAVEVARFVSWLAVRAADWVREGAVLDRMAAPEDDVADGTPAEPGSVWTDEGVEHRRRLLGATILTAVLVVGSGVGIWRAWDARAFADDWARWNYAGYEDKPAWPEFEALIETMDDLPPGRALWEPSSDINAYGTTLALELLPYYTDGRIGSMEGLYFESAGTTPFHFLTVSELTAPGKASNPVRGLSYGSIEEFDLGVRHLQLLGVRYYLTQSPEASERADAHPDLDLVAESPDLDDQPPDGWKIYEVRDAPLVEGLQFEPVVAEVRAGSQSECFGQEPPGKDPDLSAWECAAAPWWRNLVPHSGAGEFGALDRPFTAAGPDAWERIDIDDYSRHRFDRLDEVTVTDIVEEPDRVSFRVSEPGVPVLVKVSYFPNWKVSGADGPYRVAPNFMVVVPTEREVTLTYGLTAADWLARLMFLAGVAGLVLLVLGRPRSWFAAGGASTAGESTSGDADGDADRREDDDAPRDPDDGPPERAEPTPAIR